jgi:hypothetical protein
MGNCNLGSTRVSRVGLGVSPKRSLKVREPETASPARETRALPGKSAWRAPLCRRPKIWDTTARVPPGSKTEKEMPDRASLAIRHLVDVQLAAAKTELCVTVVFFEPRLLSLSRS